jgi:hypothetical protein
MDTATLDAIGKALYEACKMDEEYPWDDILAKHVWIRRAEAVVRAYLECMGSAKDEVN